MLKGLMMWLAICVGVILVVDSLFYSNDVRGYLISPLFFALAIVFAVIKEKKNEN